MVGGMELRTEETSSIATINNEDGSSSMLLYVHRGHKDS